jgi:hypothetical protein
MPRPLRVHSYQEIKRRKQGGDPQVRLTATQHLLSAAEASTSRAPSCTEGPSSNQC